MGIDELERIEITSRAQWRRWLEREHATSPGVWVITYKRKAGELHVPWAELVKEALCFGWIDGRTRSVDDERTSLYVTRRKPGGHWSAVNKGHIEELEAEGLMMAAGRAAIEAAKADGSWTFLDDIEALVEPQDLVAALDGNARARSTWDASPPSKRKQVLHGLKAAKTAKTRNKRLEAALERCARGEHPIG